MFSSEAAFSQHVDHWSPHYNPFIKTSTAPKGLRLIRFSFAENRKKSACRHDLIQLLSQTPKRVSVDPIVRPTSPMEFLEKLIESD